MLFDDFKVILEEYLKDEMYADILLKGDIDTIDFQIFEEEDIDIELIVINNYDGLIKLIYKIKRFIRKPEVCYVCIIAKECNHEFMKLCDIYEVIPDIKYVKVERNV